MKLKLPNFEKPIAKLRSFRWQAKTKAISRERMPVRRRASMRRAAEDFDDFEEPTTRLSSAFIVVLILHIVAVAGIYAFNSIKARRDSREMPTASRGESSSTPRVAADGERAGTEGAISPRTTTAGNVPVQKTYEAHGGETLTRLAALHGVSASEIAQLNALRESAVLKAGQTIVIPQGRSARPSGGVATSSVTTTGIKRPDATLVKNDDSAYLNGKIPATGKMATPASKPTTTGAPAKPASPKTYAVAKGDTLTSIAKKNNVSVEELMKLNKIEDSKKLQIAQTLKLPPTVPKKAE